MMVYMTDQPAPPLSPVYAPVERDPNLADKVCAALTDSILNGSLPVGERLPAERTLMELFGVSRTVVREATRSLAAKGLVTAEPRRGYLVADLGTNSVGEAITLYLRGSGHVGLSKVHEVRAALEMSTAALAAARASKSDVEAIAAWIDLLDEACDTQDAAAADIGFHREIAQTTGNEHFVVMLDSVREVLEEAQLAGLSDPETVVYARAAHREILQRIVTRDEDGARRAMASHLSESARRMRLTFERELPIRSQARQSV